MTKVNNISPEPQYEDSSESNAKKKMSWWAKGFIWLFFTFIALAIVLTIAVNLDITRQYAARKALDYLNRELKLDAEFSRIDVNIFGDITLHEVRIRDHKKLEFIKAKELIAESNWFNLLRDTSNLKFDRIAMLNPDIKVITYQGEEQSNFNVYLKKFESGKPKDTTKVFELEARADIYDGKFLIHNQNKSGDDGKWLDAEKFNLHLTRINVKGSEVTAQLRNLNFFTKRYGKIHQMETMSALIEVRKNYLSLGNLTFNTSHSLLQGNLRLDLPKTGYEDFSNKVVWNLSLLRGSGLSGYDLSFFVPNWDNYSTFSISGGMQGTLNNFTLKDFIVRNQELNVITPKIGFKGLTTGNFNIQTPDMYADLRYADLRKILPGFIAKKLGTFPDVFGRIRYSGALGLSPAEVVTRARIQTAIGNAVTNLALRDYSSKNQKYVGTVELDRFQVSALTKNKTLGSISGKFRFDGVGFDPKTMQVRTTSHITRMELMGKPYRDIYLDGLLKNRAWDGRIHSYDPNADASIIGVVDFSSPRLKADIEGDIRHLNLKYMGVQGDAPMVAKGRIEGHMEFKSVNDMIMDTRLRGMHLTMGKRDLDIPDGRIRAFFEEGQRVAMISLPELIEARVAGKFNLEDLGKMFQAGVDKLLYQRSNRYFVGQSFSFEVDPTQRLMDYVDPNIRLQLPTSVSGSYNGNTNRLIANVTSEGILYLMNKKPSIEKADQISGVVTRENPSGEPQKDSVLLSGLNLAIDTNSASEQLRLFLNRGKFQGHTFHNLELMAKPISAGKRLISLSLEHQMPDQAEKDSLTRYIVNAYQSQRSNGDILLQFAPTEFGLAGNTWTIDTTNEQDPNIVYQRKTGSISLNNLRLSSGESSITLNGRFKSGKDFDLTAQMKDFEIQKALSLVPSKNKPDVGGVANGSIRIRNTQSSLEPIVDLKVEELAFNNKKFGILTLNTQPTERAGIFAVNANMKTQDFLGNSPLSLTGTIDNNGSSPKLDLRSQLQDFDLSIAGEFAKGVVSNLRGKASGDIIIGGTVKDIDYRGDIVLRGVGMKLDFSGVDYRFADTTLNLRRGNAILNSIGLQDERSNSKGALSGAINFEDPSKMEVDLIISADNLMMLNSTRQNSEAFWGRVMMKGDIFVYGPVSELTIKANAEILRNSSFTLNSGASSSVDEFRLLRFLQKDEKGNLEIANRKKAGVNMHIDLGLKVDDGTQVEVLIGDEVGNISVRGESEYLRFQMGPNGRMQLNGRYEVSSGTFVSRTLREIVFNISPESYIAWDGDVLAPDMNITATNNRIVSNAGEYLGIQNLPATNVLLTTRITQNLRNPKPEIDIKIPEAASQVREALATRLADENEKTIQFSSLLVLNSFNLSNAGAYDFNVSSQLTNQAYSTAFKQLGAILNTASNDVQFDFDYIAGDNNSGSRFNASQSFKLFNNWRFRTAFGVPMAGNESNTRNVMTGEGSMERDFFLKNSSSKLLVRAYSKPSNIGLNIGSNANSNQVYGAGVVWEKSFNNLWKVKKKADSQQVRKDSLPVKRKAVDSVKSANKS